MAIDAKVSFLNYVEKRMSDVVTMNEMMKVMSIISDVMEGFEIKETILPSERKDDYLDCYLDALKVQGRSVKTISRYEYVIKKMMDDILIPTRQITVYHLRSYLAKLQERGMKDSSIEGIRQVLSAFFNWLHRESLIEKNPVSNLGVIKCAKLKKKIFTEEDIDSLKQSCTNERDRAIICFLAATGCRVSEMTGLNREDIDFIGLKCVVRGKGNKERTVFMDRIASSAIKKYLIKRKDDNPALFVGRGAKRLEPNGIRVMMKKLEQLSGVDHVHPHKFRRTLATDMARNGMPIQQISAVLGHDKIDTTMTYVIQDEEDIQFSYRRYA